MHNEARSLDQPDWLDVAYVVMLFFSHERRLNFPHLAVKSNSLFGPCYSLGKLATLDLLLGLYFALDQ